MVVGSRRILALAVAGAAVLLAPGAALAEDAPPQITTGPTIAGLAQEDATVAAEASWTGSPEPTPTWQWLRCDQAKGSCENIKKATAATYRVTGADVGHLLRVKLKLTNKAGSVNQRSEPTAAVTTAPAPTPAPTPVPSPAPTPPPTPPPPAPPSSFDLPPAAGAPAVVAPALLSPFPVVRIKGWLTAHGARITLFTVRAPRGSRIAVACRGAACPARKLARPAGFQRLRRFERVLRAGTRLDLTVTKPGTIGKWTGIVIRRGLPPRRVDGCLDSDTKRHVRCPG